MTLKEELFNRSQVTILGDLIHQVYPDFRKQEFIDKSVESFPPLELKERMSSVRKYLKTYLPSDYVEAINILTEAMKIRKGGGFIFGSVLEFPEVYGCTDEHVDLSIAKLAEWTGSLSSEFAIRPFLDNYPEKTMIKVMEWTKSKDQHIRRLASEGLRPSLPWGPNINMKYKDAAKPLDSLYYDNERYVTRSVANHLNDISKIDPSYVLNKLKQWIKEGKQNKEELDYMIHHSLRTLKKRGHIETLNFLGFKSNPNIELSDLNLKESNLKIGEKLEFEFTIASNDNCKLMIDYIVKFPTKTKKVPQQIFKLKTLDIKKDEEYLIEGRKTFKHMSTRKMKVGKHSIHIQVNGKIVLEKDFYLK